MIVEEKMKPKKTVMFQGADGALLSPASDDQGGSDDLDSDNKADATFAAVAA